MKIYVGKVNIIKEKRKRFFFSKMKLNIGYFMDDESISDCKTYDNKLNFCKYKGNFVDNIKKGFEIMHYNNGDLYEWNFDNIFKNIMG